jgi:hypothetical protein
MGHEKGEGPLEPAPNDLTEGLIDAVIRILDF